MNHYIVPRDYDWENNPPCTVNINEWEGVNRIKLPQDYKRFMSKYDGGHIYPNTLYYDISPEKYPNKVQRTTFNRLYGWKYIQDIWDGKEFFQGRIPEKHLMFGSDPGGLVGLMSLNTDNHGKIYAWITSLEKWGFPGNDKIYPLANSFTELISRLNDPDASNFELLYRDFWTPRAKLTAKKLEF